MGTVEFEAFRTDSFKQLPHADLDTSTSSNGETEVECNLDEREYEASSQESAREDITVLTKKTRLVHSTQPFARSTCLVTALNRP